MTIIKFMSEPIVSISGIRGILGESLTPENIVKYITAFAKYVSRKRIVIGRDGRLHGDLIEKIVESTLLMSGCEVINLGMVPTPTISLAVETLKANGGISITASHNPQEWNGMKFINSSGIFLNADENNKFLNFVNDEKGNGTDWDKVNTLQYYPGFEDYHIKRVLKIKSLSVKKIKKRKFKIVLDCVNSSGSFIVPKLLAKLGCKVIKIDCDGSGIFTRKPEPLPENLKKTCKAVKKNNADIGIVVDPDADRLVFITEEGKPFGEENTITAFLKHILKSTSQKKRIAAVNLSTSRSVDDIVKALGGKLYKSPVGEINVIGKMKEHNAVAGGEGSGGVILPELHFGRDSLVGIAVILSEFAEFKGKVSEYKKQLPEYHITKAKISLENINPDSIFNFLREKYKEYPQNNDDGLRIDFKDSWTNFRKSNTEPIMRIITEAKTPEAAIEQQDRFLEEISTLRT
jgi:phosphomannomutase